MVKSIASWWFEPIQPVGNISGLDYNCGCGCDYDRDDGYDLPWPTMSVTVTLCCDYDCGYDGL